MPHTAQIVYTSIWGSVVLAFAVYAAILLVRRRDPLLALLLVGGAVAYFNEPIDDLLGLVWHPRPGQWVALDTFGPVPVWGVFVYMALFGGIPYLMLQALKRGVSATQVWTWIGVFWLADIAVEIPALASGMYQYYGDPPMKVFGLPLYWFAINIGGPLETAVLLLVAGSFLTGWRMLLLVLIPMVLDAAASVGMGWPIFSALHAETNLFVKYLAALATIAMAVTLLAITIRFAAGKSQAMSVRGADQGHRLTVGSAVPG
ncbi:hypothetical protein [Mycobacterium palustre]|uniref:Carotenoid biosynthesis protein n=1 Tax=Mycobacterium palustre TaxID=153971 RepID=A0A1X1ZJ03_9MYCO|nr:hypothetical protein [Mycobacterium palustre]MCV7102820.1 hypothetical protein [Mycobacterium palustre]ORW23310.1 hypothetical protein AWC19_12190 [Mycobacterium palustre]